MSVVLTGATGFIGRRLVSLLPDAVVLSRDPARARREFPGVPAYEWRGSAAPPPPEAFESARAVVHLAGEPIAQGRWTRARKQRIHNSRVEGTRRLVSGIAQLTRKPEVLVSASAIGYYGDRGEEELPEDAPPGTGFLAELCQGWETQARAAEALGVRVVTVRIGVVLDAQGGALERMLPLFRWGLGGRLGTGRQWMSWIHREDLVAILLRAIEDPALHGAVNGVSPRPVTNAEFTSTLARVLHRPALIPAPRPLLRLALGELGEALLASQRVVPKALEEEGFSFAHPKLEDALRTALDSSFPKSPGHANKRTD